VHGRRIAREHSLQLVHRHVLQRLDGQPTPSCPAPNWIEWAEREIEASDVFWPAHEDQARAWPNNVELCLH
jgi:hypothetical protein